MSLGNVFASIQKIAQEVTSGPWQANAQRLWGMAECWMRSHRTNGEDLQTTTATGDFGDRGEAHTRGLDAYALSDFAEAQLWQILRALRRVEDGTYGVCEECGGKIPPERRWLVPDATRCIGCQGKKRTLKNR